MRRDWVVWLGCVLLFGCGAIWAQIPIKSDFFVVDNVHDLLELLGALATIFAVCVAAANINIWKQQVNATADLELARKVVTSLYRYKSNIMDVWVWAEFAVAQLKDLEAKGFKLSDSLSSEIEGALARNSHAQLELKDLLLQCQRVWRVNFSFDTTQAFVFADRCSSVAKNYLLFSRTFHSAPQVAVQTNKTILMHWTWFEGNEFHTYKGAITHAEKLISALEQRIDEKLLVR